MALRKTALLSNKKQKLKQQQQTTTKSTKKNDLEIFSCGFRFYVVYVPHPEHMGFSKN